MKINVKCSYCSSVYDVNSNNGVCPACGAMNTKNLNLQKRADNSIDRKIKRKEEESEEIRQKFGQKFSPTNIMLKLFFYSTIILILNLIPLIFIFFK